MGVQRKPLGVNKVPEIRTFQRGHGFTNNGGLWAQPILSTDDTIRFSLSLCRDDTIFYWGDDAEVNVAKVIFIGEMMQRSMLPNCFGY